MYNRNDPTERAKVEKVVDDMIDRALEMEGSCTVWNFPASHLLLINKKSLTKFLGRTRRGSRQEEVSPQGSRSGYDRGYAQYQTLVGSPLVTESREDIRSNGTLTK